jgi:hypothetical protein
MDCETLLRIDGDGVIRNTLQEYDRYVPEICPQPVVACVWKGAIDEMRRMSLVRLDLLSARCCQLWCWWLRKEDRKFWECVALSLQKGFLEDVDRDVEAVI